MNWESAEAFWAMGGHGLYVWGSYGVTALLVLAEIVALGVRSAATRRRLAREAQASAPGVRS